MYIYKVLKVNINANISCVNLQVIQGEDWSPQSGGPVRSQQHPSSEWKPWQPQRSQGTASVANKMG